MTVPYAAPSDSSSSDPLDSDHAITGPQRAEDRRPRRVALVVDDSRDIHDLCRQSLEDAGFHVHAAIDGQDALEMLIAMPTPSVVVLDLLMPRMTGLELYEILRSYRRLADVPVLVITASNELDGDSLEHARILKKPFQCHELIENVEALLDARRTGR